MIYVVTDETTLSQVAARVYGDATLWTRIWNANQSQVKTENPDSVTSGTSLIIPDLPERELPQIKRTSIDALTVDLDGYQLQPVSARIVRAIDTIADGFVASVSYVFGDDPQLDERVKPYQYTDAKVSIWGERVLTGTLYTTTTNVSQGSTIGLSGATSTADLVDSTLKPPFEFNNITLNDLVSDVVGRYGFKLFKSRAPEGAFDRVTATSGDTAASFLLRMARQRGVLLTCNEFGGVELSLADTDSAPVATLEEGVTQGITSWGGEFDGRKLFNAYRAVGRGPSGGKESIAIDNTVPKSRFKSVMADETTAGDIDKAAQWLKNKTLADSLAPPLTIAGWHDPNGNLWKPNTKITIRSQSLFIPNGFDFLINRVEYVLDSNGMTTVLSLTLPSVYTDGEVILPW